MRFDIEEHVIEIIEYVNATTSNRFSYAGIKRLAPQTLIDSPSIYLVPGLLAKDDAVLRISSQEFPDSVEERVQKSRRARNVLSDDLAAVIPKEIFDGRFMGRSYAIWPMYRPISDYKIIRLIQKWRLYDNVFAWLRGVAAASINRNVSPTTFDQRYRLPLEHVCETFRHSTEIRYAADRALRSLEKNEWRPASILQHTDFWHGNLLLPHTSQQSSDNKFGFFVIDWGGSCIDGAPGFDLTRFCMSANLSLQNARAEFLNYMQSIGIEREAFIFEVIAAIGGIGINLNQFPEDRYIAMGENCVKYLRAIGLGL